MQELTHGQKLRVFQLMRLSLPSHQCPTFDSILGYNNEGVWVWEHPIRSRILYKWELINA